MRLNPHYTFITTISLLIKNNYHNIKYTTVINNNSCCVACTFMILFLYIHDFVLFRSSIHQIKLCRHHQQQQPIRPSLHPSLMARSRDSGKEKFWRESSSSSSSRCAYNRNSTRNNNYIGPSATHNRHTFQGRRQSIWTVKVRLLISTECDKKHGSRSIRSMCE